MTLDLAYLIDFQALVETGNFSRAARQRNMTQPAFSRRIRMLEDWAGVPLFHRDTQPIGLTAAGLALGPKLAEALRCLTQGREEALAANRSGQPTLHFAATHVLSFTFFPAWFRGLENEQPLGAVQLVSNSLRACEQLMAQGQTQFLLCHHHASAPVRLDPRHYPSVRIGQDILLPVAAPDRDGAARFRLPSPGHEPVPYLAYSDDSGLGRIVAAERSSALAGMRLNAVFTSHLAAALRTMAAAGGGVAWLPRSLIAEDLAASKLVRAGPAALDVPMEIHLFRPAADLGGAAERFWTLLTDRAKTLAPKG